MLILWFFVSESAANEHDDLQSLHFEDTADDHFDGENVVDLDGVEKEIIDQTSNNFNRKLFKMWALDGGQWILEWQKKMQEETTLKV